MCGIELKYKRDLLGCQLLTWQLDKVKIAERRIVGMKNNKFIPNLELEVVVIGKY